MYERGTPVLVLRQTAVPGDLLNELSLGSKDAAGSKDVAIDWSIDLLVEGDDGRVCLDRVRCDGSACERCPISGSPFSHSLRALCTVLLDPRDPLL